MNSALEFDSEFCNVRYKECDKVVLLTWKKLAQGDNYRRPTLFALDLLRQYPGSNFIVDAKNGFEDDKEDVEWGFTELLPSMSTTGCRQVVFIMQKVSDIEEEMDLWTKEFGKYFAVSKAASYEEAVHSMNHLIQVNVKYTVVPGKRNEFLDQVEKLGIANASKAEPGNYRYEYYTPLDSESEMFLMELWTNDAAIKMHGETDHYQQLQALKKEYVTDVNIEKYVVCANRSIQYEVLNCIHARRSTRIFQDRQIEAQQLDTILDAATWAPSGGNNQTWLFTAIQKQELLLKLNELVREGFQHWTPDDDYPGKLNAKALSARENYNFYYHAPTLIIASNRPGYENAMADCSLALQNIFLAAQSLGLGSCYINQLHWLRNDNGVRDFLSELGIPREHTICSAAAIGYIGKEASPPPRKEGTIRIIK